MQVLLTEARNTVVFLHDDDGFMDVKPATVKAIQDKLDKKLTGPTIFMSSERCLVTGLDPVHLQLIKELRRHKVVIDAAVPLVTAMHEKGKSCIP